MRQQPPFCDADPKIKKNLRCLAVNRAYMMSEAMRLGGNGWRLPTRHELG